MYQPECRSQRSSPTRFSHRVLRLAGHFVKAVLVYVLSFVLVTQPLLAQAAEIQTDANASAANRPTVGGSG